MNGNEKETLKKTAVPKTDMSKTDMSKTDISKTNEKKKKKSLMRNQKRAIIILVVAVVLLAVLCGVVLNIVRRDVDSYSEVEAYGFGGDDTVSTYYSRKTGDTYVVVRADGTAVESYKEEGVTYYQTGLGTLLTLDESGMISVYARVDYEGKEAAQGSGGTRILLFPKTDRADMISITAVNQNGGYTIYTEDGVEFALKGYESAPINRITLSAIVTKCGFAISYEKLSIEKMKQQDARHSGDEGYTRLVDENGQINFAAYGLEESEDSQYYDLTYRDYAYDDVDKKYPTVTTVRVYVGDKSTDGNYYYVRFYSEEEGNRNAVYYMVADSSASTGYSSSYESTVLAGAKDIVSPNLLLPLSLTTYFDVKNFTVSKYDSQSGTDSAYNRVIEFSYEDLALRNNTMRQNIPYRLIDADGLGISGYELDDIKVDDALQAIYNITTTAEEQSTTTAGNYVSVYGLTSSKLVDLASLRSDDLKDDEDVKASLQLLQECGLVDPEHIVSYKQNYTESGSTYEVTQTIYISAQTEYGTYFVWSPVFQMIVEIGKQYLDFVEWDTFDWVDTDAFSTFITFFDSLELTSADYKVLFTLDQTHTVTSRETFSTASSSSYYTTAVTVDEYGKKSFTVTVSIPYNVTYADGTSGTKTYSPASPILTGNVDVIKAYCEYLLNPSNTAMTDAMTEYAATVTDRNVSGSRVTLTHKIGVSGIDTSTGYQVVEASSFELTLTYENGALVLRVKQTGKQTVRVLFNETTFDNYFNTTVDDRGAPKTLTAAEQTAVNEYFLTITKLDTVEKRVMASVNGGEAVEVDVDIFKSLYQTLLVASFYGRVDRPEVAGGAYLTAEQMAEKIALGDDCYLKVDIRRSVGDDLVFRMYSYNSSINFYTTVNNEGVFTMRKNRVNKIISDAQKVVAGQEVDAFEAF